MEMTFEWAGCTGSSVANWPLASFLGARGETAFFVTEDAKASRGALIEVIPAHASESDAMRESWNIAGRLDSPALLALYETGESRLNGEPVGYAVIALPDDDIGEILGARKLSIGEARAMVASAAGALEYLHSRGLRHGSVAPSNIFIAGGAVKLGVDTIAPAGDEGPAEDMRQLGGTILEALAGSRDAEIAGELPPPFGLIAKGCLESPETWTAARVERALRGEEDTPKPVAVAAAPVPRRRGANRGWVAAAVAGCAGLAAVVYWFAGADRHAPPLDPPAAPAAAVAQPVAPPPIPKPSPVVVRQGRRERPRVEQEADRHRSSADSERHWAVIAATYANFGAAQHRASNIGKLLAPSKTHVFPAERQGNSYYVVLGSGMTQDEAERLRARAIKSGAPHDSYVTILRE